MYAGKSLEGKLSVDGRVRSFPHLEGNWATSVFIKYNADEEFLRLQSQLVECLKSVGDFQPMDDYHISLSRTVVIRYHWIQPLTTLLRQQFLTHQPFCCEFSGVQIYTNEEKTRTFVALDVSEGIEMLCDLSHSVNVAFKEYNLPPYYENPRYHMSLAWVPGDVQSKVGEHLLTTLCHICERFWKDDDPECQIIEVNELVMKTGDRVFTLPLSTS